MKRQIAIILAAAMCVSAAAGAGTAEAAAKPKLSKRKLSVSVGARKTLKVKGAAGAKVTWKSSNRKATVKKAGKYSAKVAGKSKGKAVITCKVKGKRTYTLKCAVTVTKKAAKSASAGKSTPAPTSVASQSPAASAQVSAQSTAAGSVGTGTPIQTAQPGATDAGNTGSEVPKQTSRPVTGSILESYGSLFEKLGSCLTDGQLQDAKTLEFVKKQYNSFTMENSMKPEALLGDEVTPISKEEAKGLGYIVPENYSDSVVPQLDFGRVDAALKTAHDNGLKMRAHTLVWHSQTPSWFFAENYSGRKTTTPEIMDARLEFYIRSVMKHVMEKEKELTGEAGSIVYAWDVVNEYLHRSKWGSTWATVYSKDEELKPSFVKKAFEFAYSMVKEYGVQDKVALVNNDYDTYFNTDDIVAIVEFINEGEEAKICNAIGMQSHVDITRPTLEEYGAALDKFLATGLEVQITELDVTINFDHEGQTWQYKNKNETDEQQAAFISDFMKLVVQKQRTRDTAVSPKGITSVTLWGLYDAVSWRGSCSPLLFKNGIDDPKQSYFEFLDAVK